MMQMMQMMQMMMRMMGNMQQANQQYNQNPGISNGMNDYLGSSDNGSPMPWGNSSCPAGPNSSSPIQDSYPGAGNGSDAASIGRRFLGQSSIDLRGQLPHFTAAGGRDRNCADFVSSCLETSGALSGHHVGVQDLEQALVQQGYHQIDGSQAQPGDVWMSSSRSHTELVAAPGGTALLGSNNAGSQDSQTITQHGNNPCNGIYYSRR